MIFLKSDMELDAMHRANRLVLTVLEAVRKAAEPGVSTAMLDKLAEEMIISAGARPAFKGYRGYPSTLCVSLNDVIVHGIPDQRILLQSGDIVSVDYKAILNGYGTCIFV